MSNLPKIDFKCKDDETLIEFRYLFGVPINGDDVNSVNNFTNPFTITCKNKNGDITERFIDRVNRTLPVNTLPKDLKSGRCTNGISKIIFEGKANELGPSVFISYADKISTVCKGEEVQNIPIGINNYVNYRQTIWEQENVKVYTNLDRNNYHMKTEISCDEDQTLSGYSILYNTLSTGHMNIVTSVGSTYDGPIPVCVNNVVPPEPPPNPSPNPQTGTSNNNLILGILTIILILLILYFIFFK